nr:MAG TPA: hypothetical protein [Caudoviricetes sp.]
MTAGRWIRWPMMALLKLIRPLTAEVFRQD